MSDLITIKTYNSRIEAEVDKSLLESYAIKAMISADDCGGAEPNLAFATGGVKLMINEKDINKAMEILKTGDSNR